MIKHMYRPHAGPFLGTVLLACALFALFLSAGTVRASESPSPAVVPIDRIVAVVDNSVITQVQLDNQVALISKQLQARGTPLPPNKVLERQILQRMINDTVQLEFAKRSGIRVDQGELNTAIDRIAARNHMSAAQFQAALKSQGIDWASFRNEIRSEMIIGRLKERDVDSRVVVSDAEIDNFLRKQAASGGDMQYNLDNIIVFVPENASPEQIARYREKAQAALDQLRQGTDFGQVAASFSDAPNAMQGGQLGWRSAAQLPEFYLAALKTMHPGDVSGLLRGPNGFNIIKLVEAHGANAPTYVEETHVRQILLRPDALLSSAQAKAKLLQLKTRIEHGEHFSTLARQYSQDGSAANGGDLGWVSPGQTVPEFEIAMNALKPGEISNPVHTQFGWHLIQVLGRRKVDVTEQRKRDLARDAIRARKADEAYEEFVRELRDQAYVKIRLAGE